MSPEEGKTMLFDFCQMVPPDVERIVITDDYDGDLSDLRQVLVPQLPLLYAEAMLFYFQLWLNNYCL